MVGRTRWLTVAVVLVVAVALVFLWRGCRPDAERGPGDFAAEGAVLVSPDLDLELLTVRGTAKPSFTDWACLFECRERKGCRADVRVRVRYHAAGEEHIINLSGRLDAAYGEAMRVGRVQRPPTAVDRVDEVMVEVVAPIATGGPPPTPVQ